MHFDAFTRGRYATDASIYQIVPAGVVMPKTVADAEAALAASSFDAVRPRLVGILRDSRSGRELTDWGYVENVAIASEVDTSDAVPLLRDGVYQAA